MSFHQSTWNFAKGCEGLHPLQDDDDLAEYQPTFQFSFIRVYIFNSYSTLYFLNSKKKYANAMIRNKFIGQIFGRNNRKTLQLSQKEKVGVNLFSDIDPLDVDLEGGMLNH